MKILPRIHPILCVVLMSLVTSCGRRPPPSAPASGSPFAAPATTVESLVHQNTVLEEQLQAEKELHRKTEQRLALEQSWRGRWQTMTFIAAVAAVLALLVGMGLGSQTRKEAEQTHDNGP